MSEVYFQLLIVAPHQQSVIPRTHQTLLQQHRIFKLCSSPVAMVMSSLMGAQLTPLIVVLMEHGTPLEIASVSVSFTVHILS